MVARPWRFESSRAHQSFAVVMQLEDIFDSESEFCGFDSHRPHQYLLETPYLLGSEHYDPSGYRCRIKVLRG